MKRRAKAMSTLIMLSAAPAYAVFDVEGMVGQRQGAWTQSISGVNISEDSKATELRVAAHLDPIPLVPIAFGLGIELDQYNDAKDYGFNDSLSGRTLTPEVVAWLPLGDIKPYIRIGYAMSTIEGKGHVDLLGSKIDYTVNYQGTGTRVGLGLRIGIIPTLALLFEYSMGTEKLKAKTTISSQEVQQNEYPTFVYKSQGMLAGVQWGL